MNLEDIYNQLEELENNLEYYKNRLETIKSLVTPQAVSFDKIIVDGGKHEDLILKYVEIENERQLETTINYITKRIKDLNILKNKEIERLTKYGDTVKVIVLLREKEFKKDWRTGRKRHLTWEEIAHRAYVGERTARAYYKAAISERNKKACV